MASSFDGLGMGYLGSERSRFKPGEPGMGAALVGLGLQKAGVIKDLDELSNPQSSLRKKFIDVFSSQPRAAPAPVEDRSYSAAPPPGMGPNENAAVLAVQPPVAAQAVAPAMPQAAPVTTPVVPMGDVPAIDNDQLVDEVFPRRSVGFVTPDTLAQRDTSADVGVLQMASAPPSPPPMNMNQQQGGGGSIMQAIAPEILKLFLA